MSVVRAHGDWTMIKPPDPVVCRCRGTLTTLDAGRTRDDAERRGAKR